MKKNRIGIGVGLIVLGLAAFVAVLTFVPRATAVSYPTREAALQQLQTDDNVTVSFNNATDTAQFVKIEPGTLRLPVSAFASKEARSMAFFNTYGAAFGISDPATELTLVENNTDSIGTTRLTYEQLYEGLPVFGTRIYSHFNDDGQLTVVNGVFVPDIKVSSIPALTTAEANQIAVNEIARQQAFQGSIALSAKSNTLLIFRMGLVQGIKGTSHLAYEVEVVDDGGNVRDFVFVDAHTGHILDQISGIHHGIDREIYLENLDPADLVWQEGDALPYTGPEAFGINRLIDYAEDSYDMFMNISGQTYPSYDGADATMISVYNDPRISCPNANWNGISTNYCTGVDGDDTVAHEWAHAYTEYTHGLIYQWQPGALNESYSDIFGEVVDVTNGDGFDSPNPIRSAGACSVYTRLPALVSVNSPGSIAGDYDATQASFGPALSSDVTADVVAADDGTADPTLACDPLTNDLTGKVAFIRRGACNFVDKVKNAQNAGAIGAIVANSSSGGDGTFAMGGNDPTITIPSVMVGYTDGNTIEGELGSGVNATLTLDPSITSQDSVRWLSGEDDPAFGGAIRDMWTPTCYGHPGEVISDEYFCSSGDGGGVHTNSGVPNHAFALLVDGGVYNSVTITATGVAKASAIYWRAMTVYQTPSTDFADHADALEASCTDLIGQTIYDPETGADTGDTIDAGDCNAVAAAMDAVEMRADPSAQCDFEPLLENPPPAVCDGMGNPQVFFTDTMDTGTGWTFTNEVVYPGAPAVNWVLTSTLPDGRAGSAFFALNDQGGTCAGDANDHSRVMHMDSPEFTVPAGATHPRVSFWHYVSTEANWDGGNVKISVNGGPWQLVEGRFYTFNAYNGALNSALAGNTNPLAGEEGFTGSDDGTVLGTWGQSQVNVGRYAKPGDMVKLRFDFGSDGCSGLFGWYIDDVQSYYCDAQVDPEITVYADGVEDYFVSSFSIDASLPAFGGAPTNHSLEIENSGISALTWNIDEENTSSAADISVTPIDVNLNELTRVQGNSITTNTPQFDVSGGGSIVQDGSFETGSPNTYWSEYALPDTVVPFSPLCDSSCAPLAFDGDWYAWYGGWGAFHHVALSQTVNLGDSGGAQLSLWGWSAPLVSSEVFTVTLDNTVIMTINSANAPTLGWTNYFFDVSSFVDGNDHVLTLEAATVNSILIDLVSIDPVPCLVFSDMSWLSLSQTSGSNNRDTRTDVTVSFDSSGIGPGTTLTGNLCVFSNAPDKPLVVVPVTLSTWDQIRFMPVVRK